MTRSRYGAWRNAAGNMPWPPAAATAAGSSASLTTPAIGALWIGSLQPTRSLNAVGEVGWDVMVCMTPIVIAGAALASWKAPKDFAARAMGGARRRGRAE